MSPTFFNGSSAQQSFKYANTIEKVNIRFLPGTATYNTSEQGQKSLW